MPTLWNMPVEERDRIRDELYESIKIIREKLINEIKAIAVVAQWSRRQPESLIKEKTTWEKFVESKDWDSAIVFLGEIINIKKIEFRDTSDNETMSRIGISKELRKTYQEFCRKNERLSELNYARENELNSIFYKQVMIKEVKRELFLDHSLTDVNRALKKSLKSLTPKQKKVFEARFIKKYTFTRIAKIMKVDITTVREHCQAAVNKLKNNKDLTGYLPP